MRASLSEYLRIVISTWWARVGLFTGALGLASELTNLVIPSLVWWVVVALATVLAQFSAFHRVRNEREQLRAQIAAGRTPPSTPVFSPNLFEGRLFPSSFYVAIDGTEPAFVIRGALAFAADGGNEESTRTQHSWLYCKPMISRRSSSAAAGLTSSRSA